MTGNRQAAFVLYHPRTVRREDYGLAGQVEGSCPFLNSEAKRWRCLSSMVELTIDEYLCKKLMPVEGAIPQIAGIDRYGNSFLWGAYVRGSRPGH